MKNTIHMKPANGQITFSDVISESNLL